MNRIFKVVWNESRGIFTVCDEYKKSHGKTKSAKTALAVTAITAMMGLGGRVNATTQYDFNTSLNNSDVITIDNSNKYHVNNKYDGGIRVTGSGSIVKLSGNNIDINISDNQQENRGIQASGSSSGGGTELKIQNNGEVNIKVNSPDAAGILSIGDNVYYPDRLAKIDIQTKKLSVIAEGSDALGVHANRHGTLSINADNITIQTNSGSAISAVSSGKVDIEGNLTVNSPDAISVRGGGSIKINNSGYSTVKLNGNISNDWNPFTPSNGQVLLKLTNDQSYWNGNAVFLGSKSDKAMLYIDLHLENQAQWNPGIVDLGTYREELKVNNLDLNDGIINIKTAGQQVKAENLSGKGGTINVAAQKQGNILTNGQLKIESVTEGNTPHLNVNLTGITADDVTPTDLQQLANTENGVVTGEGAQNITRTQTIQEGITEGTLTQSINENGDITTSQSKNTITDGLQKIGAMNFLTFRAQTNDVSKRLGDLRTMPQTDGMWARAIAGQSEYKNIHNTYQTLQIGADKRIGNLYIGGSASYTDGDGKISNGSTDDKNYNIGLYGGWINEDGQYIDIIVKRHKLETEFDLYNLSGEKVDGSYHTWGTSASVEYGWRIGIKDTDYYIEP